MKVVRLIALLLFGAGAFLFGQAFGLTTVHVPSHGVGPLLLIGGICVFWAVAVSIYDVTLPKSKEP